MRIRTKFLGGYTLIFILATLLGGAGIYLQVKSTIETNIESDLKNSTETILNMIETAASTAIKNHLRAVAETNKQMISLIYQDYIQGKMSEAEAKALVKKNLLSQTIGDSGYPYCVRSDGFAEIHPKKGVIGENFIHVGFVREQTRLKQGYLEYEWKNPDEGHKRPKALYMVYFEPWDWIVTATSYRDEFKKLVNVSDFRDRILALSFGKTGYAYVLDSNGNLIVHPSLSGNYYNAQDGDGKYFVHEICRLKTGKLIYSWKNPGEKHFRDKIVLFNHIPEYDWIVACSSYLDEMYAPLNTIRNIIFFTVCLILALVSLTSLWINGSVLKPLQHLMNRFTLGASGDLTVRMPVESKDEIGQLAAFFNKFMETLETYHAGLNSEMEKQKKIESALRLSEEMFSKAFRCSPSGMFIASLKDARIINVNDSFLTITGHAYDNVVKNDLVSLVFFQNKTDGPMLMKRLLQERRLKNIEIKFRKKDGEKRTGLLSAEIVELWGEACIMGAMEDLTESKQLETEILNISERERQKIALELHDDICPQLIGIEVLTKILSQKLALKNIDEVQDAGNIRGLIQDSIDKTRRLSRGLFPVNLSEHGLVESLEELAGYIRDVFGVSCKLTANFNQSFKEHSVVTHLYYIAHEAVHNATKHADAERINIILSDNDEKIALTIRDNGKGLNHHPRSNGMGMKIMQYRAARIGASFDILEDPAGGTNIITEYTKG